MRKLKPPKGHKKLCECSNPSYYNPYLSETHCIKCGGWVKVSKEKVES